jgi:hypothetical protein
MADENNNKCKNELCNCPKGQDSDYCSIHCADVADRDIIEIRCDCGHQACS